MNTPPTTTSPIANRALAELEQWRGRSEDSEFGQARIAQYWTKGVGVTPAPMNEPWSGAFIAWLAHTSQPGSLARSGSHAVYAKAAINARREDQYRAYPVHVVTHPKVGDIVIKGRPGKEHTFGELHADEPILSHGDVIVEVAPEKVIAVGGNKGDTVAAQNYRRGPDGTLRDGAFAVLRRGPAPIWYFNAPEWRRATDAEVTAQMKLDARTSVKVLALGELLWGDGYLIAVETHWDAARGHHRGASVFVPAEDLEQAA